LLYFLLPCSRSLRVTESAERSRSLTSKNSQGVWQGWVTREEGQERATLIVSADGSYRALTTHGATTEGKFYLQDGKLRYRSSRTTGTATVFEDQGRTLLAVMPENLNYKTGRAEYERVK
jgi:hypothetical protein